jgi:hypothetical protein
MWDLNPRPFTHHPSLREWKRDSGYIPFLGKEKATLELLDLEVTPKAGRWNCDFYIYL